MHIAASLARDRVVRFLLRSNANPSLKNVRGYTPSELADVEKFKLHEYDQETYLLYQKIASLLRIAADPAYFYEALIKTIQKSDAKMLYDLLSIWRPGSINIKINMLFNESDASPPGYTLLHLAARYSSTRILDRG